MHFTGLRDITWNIQAPIKSRLQYLKFSTRNEADSTLPYTEAMQVHPRANRNSNVYSLATAWLERDSPVSLKHTPVGTFHPGFQHVAPVRLS